MSISNINRRNTLNFSGGPGALPESVLYLIQEAIIREPETGLSVLGISHRSDWFSQVVAETEDNVRHLLGIGDDYAVILLQGGATQQFSMVAMSLLTRDGPAADYLHTGYWSGKSIASAAHEGATNVAWSGEPFDFRRLPRQDELQLSGDAPYLHYVSNETVEGLQFREPIGRDDVPRICDMSSDFLSKPCAAERYALIYAHAQKNIGPAGVTIVVLRKDLLSRMRADLPGFLDYRAHIDARSNYNTPPVFAIYVVMLVTRWLRNEVGGLVRMDAINRAKAELLYGILDDNAAYFRGRAERDNRSLMNATFNLPSSELEQQFLQEAFAAGFSGLAGHRSAKGIRASLYNGVTLQAVEELAGFMTDFRRRYPA